MFRNLDSASMRLLASSTLTAGLAFASLAMGTTGCDKSDPASTTTTTSAAAQAKAADPTVPMNADPGVNAQGSTIVTPQTQPMNAGNAAQALPNAPNGATIDAHGQPMNAQPSLTGNRGVGGQMYAPNANSPTPMPANPSSAYGGSNGVGASPYAPSGTFNTPSAPGSMNGTQPMNTLGSVQTPGTQSNGATGAPYTPPQNVNGNVGSAPLPATP